VKTKSLALDLETLVELTPEDARNVNGGRGHKVSSVLPPAPQPTPPVHKKRHHAHQTVSSVRP
jgi:hypothetical protein